MLTVCPSSHITRFLFRLLVCIAPPLSPVGNLMLRSFVTDEVKKEGKVHEPWDQNVDGPQLNFKRATIPINNGNQQICRSACTKSTPAGYHIAAAICEDDTTCECLWLSNIRS